MENIGLHELEERIYRSYWQDGLIDVFAGMGILLIGVAWIWDFAVLGPVAPVIVISLWPSVRKRFIVPRAGLVVFSEERESRMQFAMMGLAALGVATLALGIASYIFRGGGNGEPSMFVQTMIPGLPTYLLALLMAVGGLLLGQLRGFVYAIVFMAIGVGGALLDLEPGWMMLVSGIVVLATGILYLSRFMLKYPIPENPAHA